MKQGLCVFARVPLSSSAFLFYFPKLGNFYFTWQYFWSNVITCDKCLITTTMLSSNSNVSQRPPPPQFSRFRLRLFNFRTFSSYYWGKSCNLVTGWVNVVVSGWCGKLLQAFHVLDVFRIIRHLQHDNEQTLEGSPNLLRKQPIEVFLRLRFRSAFDYIFCHSLR